MKQITKYIFTVVLCVFAAIAMAQPTTKRDKIEALRISFISQKVNLTTQETQLFWPLYNEFNDKQDNLKKSFRQQYIKNMDFTLASDKESEAYLNAELNLKLKEYELYKEYFEKFKKVLPIKKIALIRRAEEDFKKELIKNIKGNSTE
jgi:parvulin-like peptidyl-prolyl isomerase